MRTLAFASQEKHLCANIQVFRVRNFVDECARMGNNSARATVTVTGESSGLFRFDLLSIVSVGE
jgi:hypothetical protein